MLSVYSKEPAVSKRDGYFPLCSLSSFFILYTTNLLMTGLRATNTNPNVIKVSIVIMIAFRKNIIFPFGVKLI